MAKSYRKFLAGAATTAVVASSFAGVAGAAQIFQMYQKQLHKLMQSTT